MIPKLIRLYLVEDFWGLYNYIEQPSSLHHGCDYAIFKDGVKPMWEDERSVPTLIKQIYSFLLL